MIDVTLLRTWSLSALPRTCGGNKPGSCCLRVVIAPAWIVGRLDSGASDRTLPEASAESRWSAPPLSLVSKVSVRMPATSKVRTWSRPSLSVPAITR